VRGGNKVLDAHHKLIVRFRDRVLKVSHYDLADIPKICRQVLLGQKIPVSPIDDEQIDDEQIEEPLEPEQIEESLKAEEVAEAEILEHP